VADWWCEVGGLIIWEHLNLNFWHVMRSCKSGSKVGSCHLVLLLIISCSFEYNTIAVVECFYFSLISINQTLLHVSHYRPWSQPNVTFALFYRDIFSPFHVGVNYNFKLQFFFIVKNCK